MIGEENLEEKNMVKLVIEASAEEFEAGLNAAYNKNKNKISVPGFRKGKAPRKMIEKMYGAEVFYEDAANSIIPEAYAKAADECGLELVSQPKINVTQLEAGKPFIFEAVVATKPEVELGQYKGVEVTKADTEATDADVEEELKRVQDQNSRTVSVADRAVKDGDNTVIDFEGFVDGVAFEGGKGENYKLTLGSHSFIDTFEDQIVGHMPGETFDVNVTFPDDYQATNLAGKDAVFATTLNYINEDVTPDLTDDWVSSNLAESMGMNNVAELKTFVSNSLLFNQEANELYGQLYDAAEVNTDTLPEDVQQYFTNTVLYQPYLYAQMRGVSLETMLSQAGYSSVDEYLENSESSKQSMIKQILIMQALAEKNNIVCDTDILNAEFSRYFGSTDMTSYVNAYGENYVKTNILHDIVMQNQIDNVA